MGSVPKFEVIIPVINSILADVLIKNMEENSLLPKRVIIIDNSSDHYMPWSDKFLIEIYHSQTGMVNESINLGISKVTKYCDFVSILNDDIQIGPWFFERVARAFKEDPICSVVCPTTFVSPGRNPKVSHRRMTLGKNGKAPLKEGPFLLHQMSKKQGWSLTFRKKVLDIVPKIPNTRIETFHGDDWFWLWTTKYIGMHWCVDSGNSIYHMIGQSTLKLGKRKDKKKEHNEYMKILEELRNK